MSSGFADVRRAALPSLRHRIILNFQGEAEGMTTDDIVRSVIEHTRELDEE
jgi:MoxR-like ATPase